MRGAAGNLQFPGKVWGLCRGMFVSESKSKLDRQSQAWLTNGIKNFLRCTTLPCSSSHHRRTRGEVEWNGLISGAGLYASFAQARSSYGMSLAILYLAQASWSV